MKAFSRLIRSSMKLELLFNCGGKIGCGVVKPLSEFKIVGSGWLSPIVRIFFSRIGDFSTGCGSIAAKVSVFL